jgi:general secretion pathway protein M
MIFEQQVEGLKRSPVGRWFYGREHNEQRILAGLSGLIVITLLWASVWKPVSDWRETSVNRQQNAQQLHDWLLTNESAARKAASTKPNQSRSLTPIITRTATAHEISVSRLQPESNGVVSVVLQQQSFNKIIAWVAQMEENNGVSVERASLDSLEEPGFVNAQIRLN